MIPRQLAGDDRALVIIDWSWWCRTAWALKGLDMASVVCGWLARLLSDPMPPSLVLAVDPANRWTFRHASTQHLPEDKRYKAGRSALTPEYIEIEKRLRAVIEAHRIPILEPEDPTMEQNWEADDSAARAVRLASREGRSVAIITKDKDALALVTDDPTEPIVIRWDGREKVDTEESVIKEHGVTPRQITDLLSMRGDNSDGVPGVVGMGPKGAKSILTTHGTMDAALAAEPSTRWERMLHDQKEAALFSRTLIKLWDEAPIAWEPAAQAVGGFDVRALERLYRGFGFTKLAESTPNFPKAKW